MLEAEATLRGQHVTSAKNTSVWAEWLCQSGHAPSEPSETPWWWISLSPASIPRVVLHIALPLPFRSFFSLCRSPILNKHSGIVANCDHTSEWVHLVHACIGIAMQTTAQKDIIALYKIHSLSFQSFDLTRSFHDFVDPRNCVNPRSRVVL